MNCPQCGSSNYRRASEEEAKPFGFTVFSVRKCINCNHIWEPSAPRLKFMLGIVLLLISFPYVIWFFSMAKETYYMDKSVTGYVTGDSQSPDKYVVITKKGGQEISRRQATQEDLNRDKLKGKGVMLLLFGVLLLIPLAGIIKGISMMKANWPLKQQRK
jgi:Ca2+/Na+ antiporter